MSKLGNKIQIGGCVFTFSVKLEKWSFHVADLPRTGKKCTEIKKACEGVQSSCFGSLNIQNLWRCRCRRVVDLKLSNDEKDGQTWTCNFERRFRYRRVVDLKLSVNGGVVDHNIPYMEYYSHLLYSWRFSRYSAPIHWLVHGHMTPNNETVYRQMPWAGNLAKLWRQTGNSLLLPAKCWLLLHVIRACSWRWPDVVAGISERFPKFYKSERNG